MNSYRLYLVITAFAASASTAFAQPLAEPITASQMAPDRAPAESEPGEWYRPARSEQTASPHGALGGVAFRVLGVRPYAHRGTDDERNGWTAGLALAERGGGMINHGGLTVRYLDEMQFGVDPEGVAYRLAGELSLGARYLWLEGQGPLARIGLRSLWTRVGGLERSELTAPELQLGYQWQWERLQIDAAALLGYTLLGAARLPEQRFVLAGRWTPGALLSIAYDFIRIDAALSHRRWEGAHLTDAQTHLCWLPADMMICADGRVARGEQDAGKALTVSLGVSIHWGQVAWLY